MEYISFRDETNSVSDILLIAKIEKVSFFPKAKTILILKNYELEGSNLASYCEKKLSQYFNDPNLRENFEEDWDHAILLSKRLSQFFYEYQSVLAFIVGHEISHLKIFLVDSDIHLLHALMIPYLKEVSRGTINKFIQCPVEKECDKFGIFVASKLFSIGKFKCDLMDIKKKRLLSDEYVDSIFEVISLKEDFDFDTIKRRQIQFASQYKNELIIKWKEERINFAEDQTPKLVKIVDFEKLFEEKLVDSH